MSLTAAATFARRARHSRAAPHGSLSVSSSGSSAVAHHRWQQTRGLRFGRLWSSSLNAEYHRDVYRRHRELRYKYTENINRRLPWDKHSFAEDAKSLLKRALNDYWHPDRRGAHGYERYLNTHASSKTPDNPEGVRPGRNIEDAERAPLEHLLFSGKNKRAKGNARAGQDTASSVASRDNSASDWVIDPITNRKVPRKSLEDASASDEAVDIPVTRSKPRNPQFSDIDAHTTQEPVFYDGPPPEAELKMYNQVKIDAAPWDSVDEPTSQGTSSTTLDGDKRHTTSHGKVSGPGFLDALSWEHKEVRWHHHDGIASASGASMAGSWTLRPNPEYPDLHKYGPVRAHEPDGKYKSDAEVTQEYEDLDKYGPVRAHEPDGQYKAEQETAAVHEDLNKYGPVRAHEPDGKYKLEQESVLEHDDAAEYRPVRAHEPDGKYKDAAEATQEYEDLHKYGPVRAHEPDGKYKLEQETVQEYEDLDRYGPVLVHEPDGKYKVEQATTQEYEDLDKYGAVRAHEPDGKYKVEQEAVQKYDDLDKYGPVRAHEPDGKYKAEQEAVQTYDDLHLYGPVMVHEPDGKYKLEAEPPVDPEELSKYGPFYSHEPDGMYAANHVESKPDPAELAEYSKPFFSHEPDGMYAASSVDSKQDGAELVGYQAFRSHEPDGKYALRRAEPGPDAAELATYGPFRSHEPDGKYAAMNEALAAEPVEARYQHAFRSHEPDGKYAAQAASATEAQDLGNHEAFGYEDAETRPPSCETQPSRNAPDLEKYRTVQIDEPQKSPILASGEGCDPAELQRYQAVWWNEPDGKPTDEQTNGHTLFEYDTKGEASPNAAQEGKTHYRRMVEELMAQFAAEADAETDAQHSGRADPKSAGWTAGNAVHYGVEAAPRGKTDAPRSAQSMAPAEPFVYKILAFNPTTDCVETAETSSSVSDSAAHMTPAEVLLRISNPAKFLPHFGPLQAQGFEIVSGNADVLVFRKVREAVPDAQVSSVASSSVNPVDMTGAAPAALGSQSEEGVHREEPAVSGEAKSESGKQGRKNVTKRVAVGAAWLAGISYSLGVVGEYFRTGGSDGTGPRGL